jgi:hypothetical protein
MEKTSLQIKTSLGQFSIDTSTIVRIEASSNYSRVYFSNGKVLVTAKVLKWFEEMLQHQPFVRLHRSHLVNNNFMQNNQRIGNKVQMRDGKVIQVSKRRKKAVWTKLLVLILTIFFIKMDITAQNVGIGTSTPTGRLHIDLTGTANTNAIIIEDDGDPIIQFSRVGLSKGFIQAMGDDFKIATYSTNNLGKLILRTNGTDRMFFTPSGNIGIGIADPTSRFHITGGADVSLTSNGYLMLGTDGGINLVFDNNEIQARTDSAVSDLFLQAEGGVTQFGKTSDSNIEIENSTIRALYNGSAEELILQPNGKTRIGGVLDFATTKFHISEGVDVGMANNQSGYMMIGLSNAGNVIFDNNEIQARNNAAAAHLYLQNGGGNVFIGDATNFTSGHRLGVDGNAVVTGALRIGTTVTPSGYKLAVDGKAICTELLVRLVPNWPDYVFNQNYKLPGLNEVEDFIKKNNRLPGIPSAKTLEANGMNIGEMQKLQMQKIEELTLYIIELKKEIEKLKIAK